MALWCTYWTNENVLENVLDNGGASLDHIASNQFPDRTISVGDSVYVVNWKRGRLRIVGSLEVGEICGQARADAVMGRARYRAKGHLLAAAGTSTAVFMNRWLSEAELRAVEFASTTGPVGPKINKHGEVDHQSFRSTREITPTTKQMFDSALRLRGQRPHANTGP